MKTVMIGHGKTETLHRLAKQLDWKSIGMEVVGAFPNGREVFEGIGRCQPDLVILDSCLHEMGSREIIQETKRLAKHRVRFLILQDKPQNAYSQKAICFAADGYLYKPCSSTDILEAAHRILHNKNEIFQNCEENSQYDFFAFHKKRLVPAHCASISFIEYPFEQEKRILEAVSLGQPCEAMVALDDFFKTITGQNAVAEVVFQYGLMLHCSVNKLLIERKMVGRFDFPFPGNCMGELQMTGLEDNLKGKILDAVHLINNVKTSNVIVSQAMDFIRNHYNEDINLNMVANHVYVTPAYVSGLFKQHLGIHFVDYVHQVRIEKAKEFLKQTQLRNQEIANLLGYSRDKYFSQIFKKWTGMTPLQYRISVTANPIMG